MTWSRPDITMDSNGWQSTPAGLNIDDFRGIIAALEERFPGDPIYVHSRVFGQGGLERSVAHDEIPNLSAADARQLRVSVEGAEVDPGRPGGGGGGGGGERLVRVDIELDPVGIRLSTTPRSQKCGLASERILSIVRSARRGPTPGIYIGRGLKWLSYMVLLGLWAWVTWTLRSIPTALLTGVLTIFTLQTISEWSKRRGEAWDTSPSRAWLDMKSRSELRTERANRHRDFWAWVVGILTAAAAWSIKKLIGAS